MISSLNISNFSIFNNTITIGNTLFISGNTNLNIGKIISDLNISGPNILNNVTINNLLNISSNTIFNRRVTILSDLNISSYTIHNSTVTCSSTLNISNNTMFNNISINSLLNINSIINSRP